jgi:Aminoacyl-tRNA editing domain
LNAPLAVQEVAAMSVVTEHLEQRGCVFEVIPHRQAYRSVDEARALGIEVGEVLKTLAVRTGYALAVIPASRRLDLHLAREALGDSRARLASEEELGRDFPDYELGALPPLGAAAGRAGLCRSGGAGPRHRDVRGRHPDRVGQDADPGAVRDRGFTTVSLVKRPERGSDDPVGRRRAAQQAVAGGEQAAS